MMGWWGGETQVWDLRRCGNQPLAAWELGKNFRKLGKTVFVQIGRLGKPGVTMLAGAADNSYNKLNFCFCWKNSEFIYRNSEIVCTSYIHTYIHIEKMSWEALSEVFAPFTNHSNLKIELHVKLTLSSLCSTIFVLFWCETSVRWRSEPRPLSTFVASCAIISKFPKSCVLLTRPCFSIGLVSYCCCCL